jgi:hypothetical protein
MTGRCDARMQELRELSARFAKAKAQETYLHEFRASKLAMLMKQAEIEGHKTSAAQEREARAHPQFVELLEGLRDATELAESMRWQLKVTEWAIDVWRTQESNRRAEKRGYSA